jgi:hypothetical protein
MAALAIIGTFSSAVAQVPGIIQYQGRVTSHGTNFTGTGQFKFAILKTDLPGETVWNSAGVMDIYGEPFSAVEVPVSDGLFIVGLGDTTLSNMMTIPASTFAYEKLKLRIWFSDGAGAFAALNPDQKITSVGFALMAASVPDGAVTASKIAEGAVIGGKIGPDAVAGVNLLNQSITGAKIVANSISSAEVADTLLLERLVLGGPLWNGSLALNAAGIGESRALLTGDGNGSLFHLQFANRATGAVLSARSPGAKLNLWDAFGTPTALLGAGLGGGELTLYQINGQVGISLDGDKSVYGNPNPSGAEIQVRNAAGATGLLLDGHGTGGGGQVRVMSSSGGIATAEILGAETANTGGRITLREADGSNSLIIDGEDNLHGGAHMILMTGGGMTTAELLAAKTDSTGAKLRLGRANGETTVVIDAENDGQGGPRLELFQGNGVSTMVFVPGGGDATLGGGGLMRLGEISGNNLGIDADEIIARTNATAAPLRLNYGYTAPVVMTKVAINTLTPAAGYQLSVNGKVICEELVVQDSADWPDYVFAEDYDLMSLEEVEASIRKNKHLPGIPSAKKMDEDGIPLGQVQKQMMEKIEELTLHLIEQNKRLQAQEEQLVKLRARLETAK